MARAGGLLGGWVVRWLKRTTQPPNHLTTLPAPARRRTMGKPFGPHRRLQVEPLEDRSLPAAGVTVTFHNGVLGVLGTDNADTIVIRQTPQGVTLDANGQQTSYAGVVRVVVDG